MMATLEQALVALANQPLALCALFLVAPFIQEDSALLSAIAVASTGMSWAAGILAAALTGLILCAMCKYALGAASTRLGGVRALSSAGIVVRGRQVLQRRLGLSLITVRFVPGTRIPLYLACGAAGAPLGKFAACVALSGAAYLGVGTMLWGEVAALAAGQDG